MPTIINSLYKNIDIFSYLRFNKIIIIFNIKTQNLAVWRVLIMFSIREVRGTNLGPETSYAFVVFFGPSREKTMQ